MGEIMDKFIFVGNRFFVYEKMLSLGLNVTTVYAVKDSFLEKELVKRNIPYEILPKKNEFIDILMSCSYDYLISNGCPYIIPVTKLSDGNRRFINIHPSLLPDMKGKHPINGALLFNRRHGVTCHYMNDDIDAGQVISQIEIPITPDMNLDLLYQVSFRMEGEVFEDAYKRGFCPSDSINPVDTPIYYSRSDADRLFSLKDGWELVNAKVRAFNTPGQYTFFCHSGKKFEVREIKEIKNEAAIRLFCKDAPDNTICLTYGERYVLVKAWGKLCQLEVNDITGLTPLDKLTDE